MKNPFKRRSAPTTQPQPQPQPEPENKVENPRLILELVDNIHLDVFIEWPESGDISVFTEVLGLLNGGHLIGPQVTAAAIYAKRVGQPEKAVLIHAALEALTQGKKKANAEKPLVPPTRVIRNQMKAFQQ